MKVGFGSRMSKERGGGDGEGAGGQCMSYQQEQRYHKNPSSRCLAEGNRISRTGRPRPYCRVTPEACSRPTAKFFMSKLTPTNLASPCTLIPASCPCNGTERNARTLMVPQYDLRPFVPGANGLGCHR